MRTQFAALLYSCASVLICPALQAQGNPVPLINGPLQPTSVPPGSAGFTLTVNGAGFVSGSVVNWNGISRTTAFVSPAQLTASILASDVAASATASVTVSTPAPGGGTSNVLFFQVTTPEPTVIFSASTPLFQPATSLMTGDFNKDGKLDLAIADDVNLMVFLGKGDGTFRSPVTLATAGSPFTLAVGDFNNDGNLDLAVTDYDGPSAVSILLGNGDGTFQPYHAFAAIQGTIGIVAGDFNGDGKLDLAVASGAGAHDGTVTILLGNGDGTFQTGLAYPIQSDPRTLVTGDLNGDGHLDLAVTGDGGISIFLGKGDGSFQKPVSIAEPCYWIAAADFNGDGILDLAASFGVAKKVVSIFLGKGDGTFQPAVTYPAGGDPFGLATGDFNGDGKMDLALSFYSNSRTQGISILPGNGDGTFQSPQNTSAYGPSLVAPGDFNGDGNLDLASPSGYVFLQGTAHIEPGFLSFPTLLTGKLSKPETVDISNFGASPINVAQVVISGPDADEFAISSDACLGDSIAPGGTCTVAVTFTPTAIGAKSATMLVTDNANASPQAIPLFGGGSNLGLAPARIDFGNQKAGTVGKPKLITVSNIGAKPIKLRTITINGHDMGDFIKSTNCAAQILAKATCGIVVQFIPGTTGVKTATIVLNAAEATAPSQVTLEGDGI